MDELYFSTEEKSISLLFREKEEEFLHHFFGPKSSYPFQSLFVYGHTATGKTSLLSQTVKKRKLPHVWINCHESCTAPLLFATAASQLQLSDENSSETKKATNMCAFVNLLHSALDEKQETTYLIFDNAEVLRTIDPFILGSLLRLQDLTRVNVCTILISELPWIKFRSQMTSFDPICLHISNYSKEQLCEILSLDCPECQSESFYRSYIDIIMRTFFTVTRNLKELRHLASINFEKYCEPIVAGLVKETDAHKLWKNIETTLKEAMNSVYLREISGSKWSSLQKNKTNSVVGETKSQVNLTTSQSSKLRMTRELPFYSKFLLLAAYFASYNLPRSDIRNFVKNQGKQRKKRFSKKTAKNRHLLGPKPFNLDRMLSIFFAIVGEEVLPSSLMFSQISSLVSMRLVAKVSADEQLDCPKYKCLAELELVKNIGKTVGIDVMGYLDDFQFQ